MPAMGASERSAPDVGLVTGRTIWEMLRHRAALTPDRMMLADETGRRLSFAETAALAERVAAALQAMGIGEGTVVSWQLPTRIDTVVLSLALSRLGAVQNPIIHLYRDREVGSLLRTTRAQWFVVPGTWRGFDYAAMADRILAGWDADRPPFGVIVLDAPLPESDPAALAAPADPEVAGDQIRWLYSTSGTTSEPKAVCHTDRSLIAAGSGIAARLAPGADDVGSIPYPYAHIGGPDYLVMMLRNGLPAVTMEVFSPAESFALMRGYGVTITGGSTAHYLALLAHHRQHPGDVPVRGWRADAGRDLPAGA
jgi:cyclohexanecarboxylate-CoA ligase